MNTIVLAEGMCKCCMCNKRFTSEEFGMMHIQERHNDKLEEVRLID